jgi:hypothetical protein
MPATIWSSVNVERSHALSTFLIADLLDVPGVKLACLVNLRCKLPRARATLIARFCIKKTCQCAYGNLYVFILDTVCFKIVLLADKYLSQI